MIFSNVLLPVKNKPFTQMSTFTAPPKVFISSAQETLIYFSHTSMHAKSCYTFIIIIIIVYFFMRKRCPFGNVSHHSIEIVSFRALLFPTIAVRFAVYDDPVTKWKPSASETLTKHLYRQMTKLFPFIYIWWWSSI